MNKKFYNKKNLYIFYACLFAIVCGVMGYEYCCPKYVYYASYVYKYGEPEGIIPLTSEQVSHRESSFRFEYRRTPITEGNPLKWRVVRIENRSSKGQYTLSTINFYLTEEKVYPIQILHWKDNKLDYVEQALSNGFVTETWYCKSNSSNKTRIIDLEKAADPQITAKTPYPGLYRSINRYVCLQDNEGYLSQISYHSSTDPDIQGSITCNNDNVFGYAFELDSLHRPIALTALDKFGKPSCDKYGILISQLEYDPKLGTIIGYSFFDANNKPIKCPDGYASNRRTVDEFGNIAESVYYDENDSICMIVYGFAKVKYSYDENGFELRRSFYDVKGNPILCNDGYASIIHRYNDFGYVTERTHTDIFDRPCMGEWGFVTQIYTYDDHHNRLTTTYFNEKGSPTLTGDNYTTHFRRYDSKNRLVEDGYLDELGNSIVAMFRYSKEINLYFARRTFDYDTKGNTICITYYDENGDLYAKSRNTAILKMQYDDLNRCVKREFYGADGNRCMNDFNDSGSLSEYNNRNWMTQCTYIDTNDKPCIYKFGYATWKAEYDDRGYPIRMDYFDTNGNRCEDITGVATWTAKYDDYGNIAERHYYGTDKMPKNNMQGIAYTTATFDVYGNCIERHDYNINGDEVVSNGLTPLASE